ncbi:hypothetical protein LR48_Vigan08g031900 [Vigna angularis]|uniref:Cytochrome b561, DM13 and DOMON domain-containing protein n=2 Tax=Phaseolus angularis TaxID=3914 RepID=A0A0L9V3L9_PHAAN|nr:Cytochrome b561, DM13 and DOMON domain-containing protein [Vigna angularis]KOM49492.1 hypothetical protein LR48_Vigan08g031900 [Vigna angularis]BAT89409.1 hypothetical protein VIGAN_06035600 [Vigna angularis var. angularis]
MFLGSDVHLWGAQGTGFDNLTKGFIVSNDGLNKTYKNSTLEVPLLRNVMWSMIDVLTVWDRTTASDFGHVVLRRDAPAKPSLTVFENCKVLSKNFRLRWSLNVFEDSLEIGLEVAIGITNYMAFGCVDPSSEDSDFMIGGDVVVTGFKEDGAPIVDNFFITKYSECVKNDDEVAHGVCPNSVYKGHEAMGLVNRSMLVYGHRSDGVSFVRYRWHLTKNHGAVNYGHLVLNVSEHVNDCIGPLDAEDKEDQGVIIADSNNPLVVSSAPTMHYPNPPNPAKVLYVNKKEARVLRVEKGVSVKFSIQAGHDVALYITSYPLGGNEATKEREKK